MTDRARSYMEKYRSEHRDRYLGWSKKHYQNHKEERKAECATYYRDHIEQKKAYNQDYRKAHKDAINARRRERYANEPETRMECIMRARVSDAVKQAASHRYYIENRDRILEVHKKWSRANKERVKEKGKEWRENNLEKARRMNRESQHRRLLKKLEWQRKRRAEHPEICVLHTLRARMTHTMRGHKGAAMMMLVGCTIAFLMAHIESMFKSGMTWENYGEWHIDHIRPCSSFDLLDPEQQRQCFNWQNLQPLWASENLSKRDKWEGKK